MCAPYKYFDFGNHDKTFIDVRDVGGHHVQYDAMIFGGGAIGFSLRRLGRDRIRAKKVVAWGLGRSQKRFAKDVPPTFVPWADIMGVRDFGAKGADYVPCVSCMHPAFLRPYPVTRSVVGYFNAGLTKGLPGDIPALMSNRASVEDALAFLGSAETVVTNSYHGMYWATLLGRNVVVYGPYSSKFCFFKYAPVLCSRGGDWRAAVKRAKNYGQEPLADSVAINKAFYARVVKELGI